MATKPSDLLGNLPSASQLLEKPPVRALVHRWNRSVVAAGVRSFLDEVKSDLERRASEAHLPSLRELAERAAQHVVRLQQPVVRPTINATGCFFSRSWSSLPLADIALERSVALGACFIKDDSCSAASKITSLICRQTGAEAATIVSSYPAAVWAVLAATAANKAVLIARGAVGLLENECSLAAIAPLAGATLREVGTVNRASAAEFEAAITDETAVILRHCPTDYRIVGDVQEVEVEALVGLARDREILFVDLLGAAPLVSGLPVLGDAIPSLADSLTAGASIAIARGQGLIGGPPCGIVVGTRRLIRHIDSHPLHSACRLDSSTAAALGATLELYEQPAQLQQHLPLFQLLLASVKNLQQRAERLAPQIAAAESISCATAIPVESQLGPPRWDNVRMPSYGIAVTPTDGDVDGLAHRLQNAPFPVSARLQADQIVLDLRTVLPRQDQRLVEAFAGPAGISPKNIDQTAHLDGI